MEYIFSATTQALLALGKLEQVRTATGLLLPLVKEPATGQVVEMAKTVAGSSLQPLVAPAQLIFAPLQMLGTHLGFQQTAASVDRVQAGLQSLHAILGVLQATTAVIGVGLTTGVVLSAVNLRQTLKLKEDVKNCRLEVKDGFIDLKEAFKNQESEIIQQIDQVAIDVEFRHHRTILVQAYGRFLSAVKLMKTAMSIQDLNARSIELANARQTLGEALADYNNPQLLSKTCAAGQLRRLECVWAVEQTIALTYQLQNELAAVSDRLGHIQDKIRQDIVTVIERSESYNELDFLFPEITRIHDHDLVVLDYWQSYVDWVRSLSPSEQHLLQNADFSGLEFTISPESNALATPPEQLIYENLKPKSHPPSLHDQLLFMMKPALRRKAEFYISQQAANTGHNSLISSNLQKASQLTVANLYWYFKIKDESENQLVMA